MRLKNKLKKEKELHKKLCKVSLKSAYTFFFYLSLNSRLKRKNSFLKKLKKLRLLRQLKTFKKLHNICYIKKTNSYINKKFTVFKKSTIFKTLKRKRFRKIHLLFRKHFLFYKPKFRSRVKIRLNLKKKSKVKPVLNYRTKLKNNIKANNNADIGQKKKKKVKPKKKFNDSILESLVQFDFFHSQNLLNRGQFTVYPISLNINSLKQLVFNIAFLKKDSNFKIQVLSENPLVLDTFEHLTRKIHFLKKKNLSNYVKINDKVSLLLPQKRKSSQSLLSIENDIDLNEYDSFITKGFFLSNVINESNDYLKNLPSYIYTQLNNVQNNFLKLYALSNIIFYSISRRFFCNEEFERKYFFIRKYSPVSTLLQEAQSKLRTHFLTLNKIKRNPEYTKRNVVTDSVQAISSIVLLFPSFIQDRRKLMTSLFNREMSSIRPIRIARFRKKLYKRLRKFSRRYRNFFSKFKFLRKLPQLYQRFLFFDFFKRYKKKRFKMKFRPSWDRYYFRFPELFHPTSTFYEFNDNYVQKLLKIFKQEVIPNLDIVRFKFRRVYFQNMRHVRSAAFMKRAPVFYYINKRLKLDLRFRKYKRKQRRMSVEKVKQLQDQKLKHSQKKNVIKEIMVKKSKDSKKQKYTSPVQDSKTNFVDNKKNKKSMPSSSSVSSKKPRVKKASVIVYNDEDKRLAAIFFGFIKTQKNNISNQSYEDCLWRAYNIRYSREKEQQALEAEGRIARKRADKRKRRLDYLKRKSKASSSGQNDSKHSFSYDSLFHHISSMFPDSTSIQTAISNYFRDKENETSNSHSSKSIEESKTTDFDKASEIIVEKGKENLVTSNTSSIKIPFVKSEVLSSNVTKKESNKSSVKNEKTISKKKGFNKAKTPKISNDPKKL